MNGPLCHGHACDIAVYAEMCVERCAAGEVLQLCGHGGGDGGQQRAGSGWLIFILVLKTCDWLIQRDIRDIHPSINIRLLDALGKTVYANNLKPI